MKPSMMVLHGKLVSTARLLFVAAALAGSGVLAQSVDALVEEQVEERVRRQVERGLIDALDARLERELEQALLDDLVIPDELRGIGEIAPSVEEMFIEAVDDDGQRVERGIFVVLVPPEQLPGIERVGFTVREQRPLAALGLVLLRVEAPANADLARAVLEVGREAPAAWIDANHLYRAETGHGRDNAGTNAPAVAMSPGTATRSVSIGMVDSAVATEHEALRGADLVPRDFVTYARPRPTAHGTAIASILVGQSASLGARLPGGRLYAAAAFFEDGTGRSAATTVGLVRALDWLVATGVRVVNMSLTGPPNRILEAALDRVVARGLVVVAAVGNAGPAAAPLYPAAYATVVGVTAVDARGEVYRYANRGAQVVFSAPGVDVAVAREQGFGRESGTSFAAPHAAAILATALAEPDAVAEHVLSSLQSAALDLGDPGFDETYGFGLIVAAVE